MSFKFSSATEHKGKTMRPRRATIAMGSAIHDVVAIRSSAKNVLVIDVGGTSVKFSPPAKQSIDHFDQVRPSLRNEWCRE